MKARFVLRALWVVKCCFLYVPTLTELSHLRLNESIYSQIPTERFGGGCRGTAALRVHNALLWPSAAVFCTLTSAYVDCYTSLCLLFDLITYSLQGEDKIILEKQEDASFDHRYATLSEACVSLRQDHGRLIPGVLGLFFHYPINQSIQVCRYQVKMLHLFGRDASQSDTIARVCHSWPDIVLAQQMFCFDR